MRLEIFRVFGTTVKEALSPADPHAIPAETDLTRTVRRALQAGNGRSHLATRSEIERRLTVDGIPINRQDLETTLAAMFQDGRLGQTDAAEFYVVDDSPVTVKAKPEPPPTWDQIERHTGWQSFE